MTRFISQPISAEDSETPQLGVVELFSPLGEQPGLNIRCSNPELVDDVLVAIDRDRGVSRLVRIDTDHDGGHLELPSGWWLTVAGTPDSGLMMLAPLSSHTTARESDRQAVRETANPQSGSRHPQSPPARPLRRYETTATPTHINNQAPSAFRPRFQHSRGSRVSPSQSLWVPETRSRPLTRGNAIALTAAGIALSTPPCRPRASLSTFAAASRNT